MTNDNDTTFQELAEAVQEIDRLKAELEKANRALENMRQKQAAQHSSWADVDRVNAELEQVRTERDAFAREFGDGNLVLAKWHSAEEVLPANRQRVIAIYRGVYEHRIVTFWRDADDGWPRFGLPSELDGKGSQPATHWHPLPKLPKG